MNKLIKGDIVSVLAIVAYDFAPAEDKADMELGACVKVIGPRYNSEIVRAKPENVRMVTPLINVGDLVSTGRNDWKVLAVNDAHAWLVRDIDGDGTLQHTTASLDTLHRKDPAQPTLPFINKPVAPEPPTPPLVGGWRSRHLMVRVATPHQLHEILGLEVGDTLEGAATQSELGRQIQETDGIWTERDDGLWAFAPFNPPINSDPEF